MHENFLRFYKWWNGDLVSAVTGLKGKELGAFMKKAKECYNLEELFKQDINPLPLILALNKTDAPYGMWVKDKDAWREYKMPKTKEEARSFLFGMGMIDEKGNLTPQYGGIDKHNLLGV